MYIVGDGQCFALSVYRVLTHVGKRVHCAGSHVHVLMRGKYAMMLTVPGRVFARL